MAGLSARYSTSWQYCKLELVLDESNVSWGKHCLFSWVLVLDGITVTDTDYCHRRPGQLLEDSTVSCGASQHGPVLISEFCYHVPL
jgi:hypothetical protein